MYFSVYDCTPEQLDELRNAWYWSDERTPEAVTLYDDPLNVPDCVLFNEYAHVLFTESDFWCTDD